MNQDELLALAEQAEAEAIVSQSTEIVETPGFWRNPYLREKKEGSGNYYAPSINALIWWMEHPDMGLSHVRRNTMSGDIETELLPWDDKPHTWDDFDSANLFATVELMTEGLVKSNRNLRDALLVVADRHRYDPLVEALELLPEWDGLPRADTLLIDFLGAADTPYTRAATRIMLNGAVMRAFNPGCKFDCFLILMGAQGIGKTTFAEKLSIEDKFFTDTVGDISNEEKVGEKLLGKWIVELPEIIPVHKHGPNELKMFLGRRVDRARWAYERKPSDRPRRCIFIGTTNEMEFLTDPTGNRRYFPVPCGVTRPVADIGADDAATYIQQAWAEVMHEYRTLGKLPLVLPDDVADEAEAMRDDFTVDDPRVGQIRTWLSEKHIPGDKICIVEVLEDLFDTPRTRINEPQVKKSQVDLSKIMNNMDVLKRLSGRRAVKGYGQQRCWEYLPPRNEVK